MIFFFISATKGWLIIMKRTLALLLAVISIIAIFPVAAFGGVADANGKSVSSITIPSMVTGKETINSYTVSYSNTDYLKDIYYAGVVIPVKASKAGVLFVDYTLNNIEENANIDLYQEATLDTYIGGYSFYGDGSEEPEGTFKIKVPKSGTYYLAIRSNSSEYDEPFANEFKIKPYIVGKENRTMKENEWSTAYYDGDKTYFKFSVSKLTVVTIYSDSKEVGIKLTDSKKKAKQSYATYLDKENKYRTSYTLKKGTYYILVTGSYDDFYKLKFKTSSIPTLKAKKYTTVYQANPDLSMYVKLKTTASGYITIKSKHFSGYVTLCNSDREAIATKVYVDSDSKRVATFGVSKGKTYYLRLNNNEEYGSICFTNTKVTDQSGSSKAKAKSMSIDKTYKGYIAIGSKTKDWYKVKLTSAKYWAIDLNGDSNDTLKIEIFDSKGNKVNSFNYYGDKGRIYSYTKDKGTFYVCVSRGNKKSSGYYTLKPKASNKFLG